MTAGYPTDAADNAVQANIVSVGYASDTLPGNPFTAGSEISLDATTPCCTADYLTGDTSGDEVGITSVTASSSSTLKADATGDYIRHFDFELYLEPNDGTAQFALDATFCPRAGNSGSDYSFMYRSVECHVNPARRVAQVGSDHRPLAGRGLCSPAASRL